MSIFWMELKKLFSWPIIGLIIVLNVLLYWLLIEFEITYFPNGRPWNDIFIIEQEMIEKYGEKIDEEEMDDFKFIYDERVKEANAFLQAYPLAVEKGITTYAQYQQSREVDAPNVEEGDALSSAILFDDKVDLFWELESRKGIIDNYEYRYQVFSSDEGYRSQKEQMRVEEMIANEKFQYYSNLVIRNFNLIASYVLTTILFSLAVLLSPIFLRDKLKGIVPLQYTSAQGRNVFRIKWLVGFTALFLVTTMLLIIYSSIYWTNATYPYFSLPLFTMSYHIYWYDITFGQFIILTIIAIYLLCFLFGAITMFFSAICTNYLIQVSSQILSISAFILFVMPICLELIISTKYLPWVVPIIYIVFIMIVLFIRKWIIHRENRRDILIN